MDVQSTVGIAEIPNAMNAAPITYVVDDNERLCVLLQRLLSENGIRCETYLSAEAFLAECTPRAPGCIVLDINMGTGMNGLDLQSHLNESGCELPIMILTAHAQVDRVLTAWKNGSHEFLIKPIGNHELLEKIKRALRSSVYSMEENKLLGTIRERIASLTPREHEVMHMVVLGKPNKTIGAELGLSQKTVEVHRSHVMKKMRANSLPDLVTMVNKVLSAQRASSPPK